MELIPNADAENARAEVLQMLQTTRTELLAAQDRLKGVLLGQGWIVRCGGFHFTFTVKDKIATEARITKVERAMRFTENDAKAVAASLTNGAGEKGEAVHINTALEQELANVNGLIQKIESRTFGGEDKR